jgi:hypothetical protein
MGESRRRIKQTKTFKERLLEEAAKFRAAADKLPPGTERELLMKRVYQAEKAMEMSEWLSRPGDSPPASLSNLLKAERPGTQNENAD